MRALKPSLLSVLLTGPSVNQQMTSLGAFLTLTADNANQLMLSVKARKRGSGGFEVERLMESCSLL